MIRVSSQPTSMRPSLALVLLALVLTLGACDGLAPSDEPLPEFEALVEAYGSESIGTGYAKTGERVARRDGVVTSAEFVVSRFNESTLIAVDLLSDTGGPGGQSLFVAVELYGTPLNEMRPGTRFESTYVNYNGVFGSGRVEIISVSDSTVAAVFAADVENTGSSSPFAIPLYDRVQGGFNAVLVPAE